MLAVRPGGSRRLAADVVVVGAGGAGLVAALAARDEGADVLVLEASTFIGGTYAYSSGLIWCPASSRMLAQGLEDSAEVAFAHVRALSGGKHDDTILGAYLAELPAALDYLEEHHGVPYQVVPGYPDYYAERDGGKVEGRYVATPAFDTRELPEAWRQRLLVSPTYAHLPVSWEEIQSWGGFGTVDRWDRTLIETRQKNGFVGFGPATIGYLLRAALTAGVRIEGPAIVRRLIVQGNRVAGVLVEQAGEQYEVAADAVVLATGAFDWNDRLHRQLDPHRLPKSVGIPTVDGGGLMLALERGAAFAVVAGQILATTFHIPGEEMMEQPLWRLFVREPALPGGIVVDQNGRRFCDESFYRALVNALTDFDLTTQSHPVDRAFFVFDSEWKAKYALGSVRPGETPDWLVAGTAGEVASALGIPADELERTVTEYNRHAVRGEDPEFGRGRLLYGRNNGDRDVVPNPCVRPLEGALYAIEVHLGTLGGSGGLCFDSDGRVLDWRNEPLPGLYCAGNVGANLVEGLWYNSGIANGRALAFGRCSGRSAVRDGVTRSRAHTEVLA